LVGLAGLRYFLTMSGSSGGGQSLNSPNDLYEAYAMSYRMERFWGGISEYYEFWIIDKQTGDLIRKVRMENLDDKPQFWLRGDERIISWSSDSFEVTFAFQDIELKLKVEEYKEK
jgi:hypothetical protein